MPNRELRENIKNSEKVAALSNSAFRTFIMLLSCADDYGRYLASPRLVKSSCYPYDTRTIRSVEKDLAELHEKEMADVYEYDGKAYLQIRQWKQRVRANASKYPDVNGLKTPPTNDGHVTGSRVRGTRSEERITRGEGKPAMFLSELEKKKEAIKAYLKKLRAGHPEPNEARLTEIKKQKEKLAAVEKQIREYGE